MIPAYVAELGLTTRKTSVGAQKIDGLSLETYDMALAKFSIQDSLEKVRFFEDTFLLVDTSMKVFLKMFFFSFNNANIKFAELEKLTWKTYIAAEALPTTNSVKFINKKEFAKAALDKNPETFIVHIAILKMPTTMPIYLSKTSQVQRLNKPILAALQ